MACRIRGDLVEDLYAERVRAQPVDLQLEQSFQIGQALPGIWPWPAIHQRTAPA